MANQRRLELQSLLESILGENAHVYFQPPSGYKLTYPCIVYSLNDIDHKSANNKTYLSTRNYTVTLIQRDPDSELVDAIDALPFAKFNRRFVSDNLYHDVYKIHY